MAVEVEVVVVVEAVVEVEVVEVVVEAVVEAVVVVESCKIMTIPFTPFITIYKSTLTLTYC